VASDILDSDHLTSVFQTLDYVKTRSVSVPVEKFTDWEEADKTARDFTSSVVSAYRLSTSKFPFSDLNNDIPGLNRLFKQKQILRKLWQEIGDLACKTAVIWVSKSSRRIARKKALERWETKMGNSEVTPQAMRPTAKSLTEMDKPKA
jgi:hypothetical protein